MKTSRSSNFFVDLVTQNLGYKLIALFVTFVLWFTILGRQDFVGTKDVFLEYRLAPHYKLAEGYVKSVKFRVSGSRRAIRKFSDESDTILVDLTAVGAGERQVDIPQDSIDIPFGVKVISIQPHSVVVKIERAGQ